MSDNVKECIKELEEVLKKHNCVLVVDFVKDKVLDKDVLIYQTVVIENGTSPAGTNKE